MRPFSKKVASKYKNQKTKQKSEIRSSRLLIVTHMNGIQQKFVSLFLSVCHCWWKSVHSSRRLVQSLHMTVPIFRAQAAVSDHTLQRDNVGQGMLSRWVAAYLFRLGPYSSHKDLDFILLPYVNLVLPTWTSFFLQGSHYISTMISFFIRVGSQSSYMNLILPTRNSFFHFGFLLHLLLLVFLLLVF